MNRRLVILFVGPLLTLLGAGMAWAFWAANGTGTARASTGTVEVPTAVTVPPTSTGTVNVSWTQPTSGNAPSGYFVTRTTGDATTAACGTPTASPLGSSAVSCRDTSVPTGAYTYAVSAVLGGRTATSASSDSVLVQVATRVKFTVQPSATVGSLAIWPAVHVTVQDSSSTAVPTPGIPVTVAIATNPASGTLSGTLTAVTDLSGVATFPDLVIDDSGRGYRLSATSGTLTSATSSVFDITKRSQGITFASSAPAAATVRGLRYTATATGGGSGSAVTFSSATAPVCTVSGSRVSFVAAGTCTVNANQAGSANYNAAAQVQQTFTVAKGRQTVLFTSTSPTTATVGGTTYVATATATTGLAVVLSSARTGICTVSGSTVSFVAAGTCTVNANQAGNANYSAAPQVQQTFTVRSTPAAPTGLLVLGGSNKVTLTWNVIGGLTYQCQITSGAAAPTSGGWTACVTGTQYSGQNGSRAFYVRGVSGGAPGTPASRGFSA